MLGVQFFDPQLETHNSQPVLIVTSLDATSSPGSLPTMAQPEHISENYYNYLFFSKVDDWIGRLNCISSFIFLGIENLHKIKLEWGIEMGVIPTNKLESGMVLADEVKDVNDRLLLAKGEEIQASHIRVLKMWGVSEVNVVGKVETKFSR